MPSTSRVMKQAQIVLYQKIEGKYIMTVPGMIFQVNVIQNPDDDLPSNVRSDVHKVWPTFPHQTWSLEDPLRPT